MFAIKEAQECVINEYLCASDWRRNSLITSVCLKTPQHIFQLAPTVDIQSARQEEKKKKRQCGLCLGLIFSGEHYNQLLPSQTSVPILCDEKVIWLYKQSEMRDTILHLLCLHSQIRVTHWISLLCQISCSFSFLMVFFFLVCPDNVFTRESPGQVCSAIWSGVSPIYLFPIANEC